MSTSTAKITPSRPPIPDGGNEGNLITDEVLKLDGMQHKAGIEALTPDVLRRLYRGMALLRQFELRVQQLGYEKLVSGCHLYLGQEAGAIGVCDHLTNDDWVISNHRSHGHALAKGVPPKLIMAELLGKASGCCGGRGGSQHIYYKPAGFCCSNGHTGGGISHAVGFGLNARVRKSKDIGVALFGDGAVGSASFHESLNFAGVQNAATIFVCENNLYATETPFSAVTKNTDVASKAAAYGIPGISVDGYDVLTVWQVMKQAVERARSGQGPTLIELRTYRWAAHHEASPVLGSSNYRTQEELDKWMARCPVHTFRKQLVEEWKIATEAELKAIEKDIEKQIEEAVEFAKTSPFAEPQTLYDNVYARPINPPIPKLPREIKTERKQWSKAVSEGIAEEMRRNKEVIYMGCGIGKRGGSSGQTKGLWQEFGGDHFIDTPICEYGFTGAAVGAAMRGGRAFADEMIAGFLFEAASQIIVQAAKLRYVTNGQISVPVIVRSAYGYVPTAAGSHGATYHCIWSHVPGLIVVVPSNPADAKGLMKTALRAADPVIFFDHNALAKSMEGEVPIGEDILVPFGVANVVRQGTDLTIVSAGLMLNRSKQAAENLQAKGISCEVIDLRTIMPLDVQTIVTSVFKTGRVLVVDEDWAMCGLGGEIAALMNEHLFGKLKAPVGRINLEPVTHPFATVMDDYNVPTVERIMEGAQAIVNGKPLIQRTSWTI